MTRLSKHFGRPIRFVCEPAVIALALLLGSAQVSGQPSDPEAQALIGSVQALRSRFGFLDSFSVARHGQVLVGNADEDGRLHDQRSAAKSVVSAGLGLALGPGREALVDTPLIAAFHKIGWLPEATGQRARITTAHVLTMSAGVRCESSVAVEDPCDPRRVKSHYPWKTYLRAPLAFEPGSQFRYNDSSPTVILALIYAISAQKAETFIDRRLFQPLGMAAGTRLGWMRADDMRRLGQLYLQNGCWNGKRLLSADWIARSTRPQIRFEGKSRRSGYGYFWWWREFQVAGTAVPGFFAAGNGGQLILVLPAYDTVIVSTGHAYDDDDALRGLLDAIEQDILPLLPPEPAMTASC